jgi:hypothetical protein
MGKPPAETITGCDEEPQGKNDEKLRQTGVDFPLDRT